MPTMTCKLCEQESRVCEHLAQSFVHLAEMNEELRKIAEDLITWAKASGSTTTGAVIAGAVIDAEARLAKLGRARTFKASAPGGQG